MDPHAQRVLSLCTGYGGLELALRMAGVATKPVCYVEREAYAAANLVALMESGRLDPAPIWGDVATFDGSPWRGEVDIVTAGFPCQPFSAAGKRKGLEDERWLWPQIERILRDVRPGVVFLENVPGLLVSGVGPVLGSLSSLGFDAEWGVVRASDAGAPHRRARVFILASHADGGRPMLRGCVADTGRGDAGRDERREVRRREPPQGQAGCGDCGATDPGIAGGALAVADGESRDERPGARRDEPHRRSTYPPGPGDAEGWRQWIADEGPQPGVCGGADGPPARVDRVRLLGNGVVPQQAALAFRILAGRLI